MSKMCTMEGCREQAGMCIHEKMMLGMGVMGLLAAVGHFGLGLF